MIAFDLILIAAGLWAVVALIILAFFIGAPR